MPGCSSRSSFRLRLLLVVACVTCVPLHGQVFAQQDAPAEVAARALRNSLWVADDAGITEFAPESLKQSGTPPPITKIRDQGIGADVQLDSAGNLWGAFSTGGANDSGWIFKMTPSDLRQYRLTHDFSPTVSIFDSGSTFQHPEALALDRSGNVWILCDDYAGAPQIIQFKKRQFSISVAPQPAVSLKPSGAYPTSIEFDRSGNLWITSQGGTLIGDAVIKLSNHQLTSSGSPAPVLVIAADFVPFKTAFDRQGNLWTLSTSHPTPSSTISIVEMFRRKDLSARGTITLDAAVTFFPISPELLVISALAFDQKGNLWLGGGFRPVIGELTSAQIKNDGRGQPQVVINLDDNTDSFAFVRSLTFGPLN